MRFLRALLIAFLLGTGSVRAQQFLDYSAFSPFAGIQAGSQGIGIESGYPLGKAFNVRAGASVFPPFRFNVHHNGLKIHRANVMLNVDWQPLFGRKSWFSRKWFVSVGGSYFFKNKVERLVDYPGNEPGGYNYTVKLHQAPYVGTGVNKIRLGNQVNLSLNLGYFIPIDKPDVTMAGTGEYSQQRKRNIEDKLSSFPYNVLSGLNAQAGLLWSF